MGFAARLRDLLTGDRARTNEEPVSGAGGERAPGTGQVPGTGRGGWRVDAAYISSDQAAWHADPVQASNDQAVSADGQDPEAPVAGT